MISASAQRLQVRSDQQAVYNRQQKDRQAVEDARNKERDAQARAKAETYSQNRLDALNAKADLQRIQERNAAIDLVAQNVRDDKIDAAIQLNEDFINRSQQQAAADRNAVQAQITEGIYQREALNAPTSASVSFDAYLADRNNRLNERAAIDAQRSASSARDYARSARSAEAVRTDPSQIPDNQVRGAIVDFSA